MKKSTKIEKELKKTRKAIKNEIEQLQNIRIEKEGQKTFFEISDTTNILCTNDVAEGVAALMMCKLPIDSSYWKILLTEQDKKEIEASKALYWLTGGNLEWVDITNYKTNWHEASILFKKKFGRKLTRIVKRAKTLNDIKLGFEQKFNLVELYEYAMEVGIA